MIIKIRLLKIYQAYQIGPKLLNNSYQVFNDRWGHLFYQRSCLMSCVFFIFQLFFFLC